MIWNIYLGDLNKFQYFLTFRPAWIFVDFNMRYFSFTQKCVKSHVYWHLRTALKQIFFSNKILVRSDYLIKNKMISPSVQAMTRVWEKSHDVSFNKQVALEDAHRQAGPVTGQPGPVSGLPGLTGPVQCSMQRSLPIQRALFLSLWQFLIVIQDKSFARLGVSCSSQAITARAELRVLCT